MADEKLAAALGSATPDSVKSQAATVPVPQTVVANKPAPGQTGPRGMQPRQTFSRVNTGSPPVPDAGTSSQKNSPIRGMEFLPAKVAGVEVNMTDSFKRPDLNELVKEAMAGTMHRADISAEVARIAAEAAGGEKTAGVEVDVDAAHVPTEALHKLASAVGFIVDQLEKGAEGVAAGEGPGALDVSQATASEKNIDAGEGGQASSGNQPPKNPSTQGEQVQSGAANTGLETNDGMSHPEQPTEPISNEDASLENDKTKSAAALLESNARRVAGLIVKEAETKAYEQGRSLADRGARSAFDKKVSKKGPWTPERVDKAEETKGRIVGGLLGGALGGVLGSSVGDKLQKNLGSGKAGKVVSRRAPIGAALGALGGSFGGGALSRKGSETKRGFYAGVEDIKKKKASVPVAAIRKLAEDANNPAKISSGTVDASEPPAGATPSEEGKPPVPSDVTKQERLVGSNDAAINYTKRDAKADPKSDVNKVLNEKAQSSATDKVLDSTLSHTGEAGAKISSVRDGAIKTAAARTLLSRLVKEAEPKVEKEGDKEPKKKEKDSMGMSAPSTPQSASGFSAGSI